MRFFFPDSQDLVDPSFDFERESRSADRIRQRDDQYAHEVFAAPPHDGLLVSKGIVDGSATTGGRYTMSQRERLKRRGAPEFFRLDRLRSRPLSLMGDCGAFTYVKEEEPPYSAEEVVDFYRRYVTSDGSDRHYLIVSRVSTLFWGGFATFCALYMGRLGSAIEAVNKIGSYFYGPILGVFVLAIGVRRANSTGAFGGVLVGIAVAVILFVGPNAEANDADLDGLSDDQEFLIGTDPNNSDSDGGGENDGSEVDFGFDPLDPSDDEIQSLECTAAYAVDAAVVLVYPVRPEYVQLRLYRRGGLFQPYLLVNDDIPPDGQYTDTGLANGSTYRYRMMAVDDEGHKSATSATVLASPEFYHLFSDGFECRTYAWAGVVELHP